MKNKLLLSFITLAIISAIVFASPRILDEWHWYQANRQNRASAYLEYVQTRPKGQHITEARVLYDQTTWEDAKALNTIQGFEKYLQELPNGKYVTQAHENIETINWGKANKAKTITAYNQYLSTYKSGRFVKQAKDKIESLKKDDTPFQAAEKLGTLRAFKTFLAEFPGHQKEVLAHQRIKEIEEENHWKEAQKANTIIAYGTYILKYPDGKYIAQTRSNIEKIHWHEAKREDTIDSYKQYIAKYPLGQYVKDAEYQIDVLTDKNGRHILDLMAQNKIEVKTSGSEIDNLTVEIRPRQDREIKVLIPVGTFFVPALASTQNMVSTASTEVTLNDRQWQYISISVACANLPRDIPGKNDSFTIQRSPHQAELAAIMPVLEEADAHFGVKQAAVWIVTDNANYDQLGILVSYFGGRVIDEDETAQAMQILDQAGINIKRKAIWWNRNQIIQGLEDGELRSWLQQQAY